MTIGVRAHDYGRLPIGGLLSAIAADGWETVQLAFTKAVAGIGSFNDVNPETIIESKAAFDRTGLSLAVLGVYIEPSLTDETERKKQVRFMINALPWAKTLKAGCVGTETTALRANPHIRSLYRSLEEILPEAEQLGVDIGIEPVHYHTLNTPELTRQMLRDFSSPCLKVIFDPVNLLTRETIGKQTELWKRCMDCFGGHIAALHVKGASDEADAHGVLRGVPFTSSVVDYELLFACLRAVNAPVLREGVVPAEAKGDLAFLKSLALFP
jgi:sugar phosphate isomerase/epimerase